MKRFVSVVVSFVFLLIPLTSFAKQGDNSVAPDDECIYNIFLKYADSLGAVSYKEVKEHIDSLGYKYETKIGHDELATFNIICELGSLYICFYPFGFNDSDFGDPMKEKLCCLEYSRDNRWISISDDFHTNAGILKTGDKSRNPVNQEVSTLEEIIEYYNNTIGGPFHWMK